MQDWKNRKLTDWPTIRLDLKNAGAQVVDQDVVVDQGLITSRGPDDLPAFCNKLIEEIAEGPHSGQRMKARQSRHAPLTDKHHQKYKLSWPGAGVTATGPPSLRARPRANEPSLFRKRRDVFEKC